MKPWLEYEIDPGDNVPQGLPRQRLPVLSPIWKGEALLLEYPDGEVHTLVGWSGSGEGGAAELQVFWTRHRPEAPAVCLAIGGDAGLRNYPPDGAGEPVRGMPFLALAESLIPKEVLKAIGPQPAPEPRAPLLLA